MARVFISHSSEDLELACEIRRLLLAEGHEVFLDAESRDGIAVGVDWQERLHERLRWADAMICLVTSAYTRSIWCAAEIGAAQARGSRLLPVHAEPGVKHTLLGSLQHIDIAHEPEIARSKLIEALRG